MTSTPEISGYRFDQRLLDHPLAEIWHGRSFTGMEIVALFLSEAGAAGPQVRERLSRASRGAALEPDRHESPLWAANFSTPKPYAITQLLPGQSGAERLIDPLDGVLGNDEESLRAVRSQLTPYGAAPPPSADLPWQAIQDAPQQPGPVGKIDVARQYGRKMGRWVYVVVILAVLVVFSVTYSVGAAIGSAVKDPAPTQGPAPALVTPGALPTPGLLAREARGNSSLSADCSASITGRRDLPGWS